MSEDLFEHTDPVRAALQAASDYCKFVEDLSDNDGPSIYPRLVALLLKLGAATEKLTWGATEGDSDIENQASGSHYVFAMSKFGSLLDRDFRRIVALEDASFSGDKDRIFMLPDDLSDIFADIRTSCGSFADGIESQRVAADNLRLTYEIHWADHLYRALYSLYQLRFSIFSP